LIVQAAEVQIARLLEEMLVLVAVAVVVVVTLLVVLEQQGLQVVL
jgi:hypothetical protein